MSKTIFIEGLGLVDGHFSGIGQYILGILRGLDHLIEKDKLAGLATPDVRVVIPFDEEKRFNKFGFKHIRAKKIPIPFRYAAALWHRQKMPPLDLLCGPGFYVFTRFVTMPLLFSKSAVILYDLSFELHKEYSDDKNAAFLSKGTRHSIEQVKTVFTISQSAKQEICEFYKLPSEKVLVATPAADQRFFFRRPESEIQKVKDKYELPKEYILALSNLEPRKNLETLVDAYCALPEKYRHNISLLLVGVSGWKTDKLFGKIINLVKDGYSIVRPSEYVHDRDKPALISGAKMLVYPSHYEGFGMPPLEALACGVPVITADNSSLPEVVGDAGLMLDHTDTKGFSKKMEEYLEQYSSVKQSALVKGPSRASLFSWEKSAAVYWERLKKEAL